MEPTGRERCAHEPRPDSLIVLRLVFRDEQNSTQITTIGYSCLQHHRMGKWTAKTALGDPKAEQYLGSQALGARTSTEQAH